MSEHLDLKKTYKAIIEAARAGRFISYGDLAKANNAPWQQVRYKMNTHLGELVRIAATRGWPIPSAIVSNQNNLESGTLDGSAREGFIAAAKENGFTIEDPAAFVKDQQRALFAWAPQAPDELGLDECGEALPSGTAGPRFVAFFGPLLDTIRALGGAAERKAVYERIRKHIDVPEKELGTTNKNGLSRFENQIDWARFYLVKAGLIENKKRGIWQLTTEGLETYLDHESALALFKDVRERFKAPAAADTENKAAPADNASSDLFDDPNRRFWFVGGIWGGTDDQTERFLHEGIWQSGHDDERYDAHVARMQRGDRIALKAAFTKKYGLPFDNQNKPVSCMRIKAIGTVTAPTTDGKTVSVDWQPLVSPKEWYFYTYRTTIVEADPAEELARRLIRFTFGDHPQNFEFWLRNPYWAKRYRSPAETLTDSELEEEEAETDVEETAFDPYGLDEIVGDGCFFPRKNLQDALDRLQVKKNLILQGPPGTGKTWLAKRLGYALIGTRDRAVIRKRMRAIQFHPSLSYEDFVRGWRPNGSGQLSLIDGVFLEAVEAARAERDLPFVVIIEEINRGNPAQIFGEMLTLLENDKRREDEGIEIAYRHKLGERVYIPDNLYVIGTMNIADRSLALVDLALRRRFAFVNLETALNEHWRHWCVEQAGIGTAEIDEIQRRMCELNDEIANDRSLGAQFRIGHSYVTPGRGESVPDARSWFARIVETEIGPLLEEYWFDNLDKAASAKTRLLEGL